MSGVFWWAFEVIQEGGLIGETNIFTVQDEFLYPTSDEFLHRTTYTNYRIISRNNLIYSNLECRLDFHRDILAEIRECISQCFRRGIGLARGDYAA